MEHFSFSQHILLCKIQCCSPWVLKFFTEQKLTSDANIEQYCSGFRNLIRNNIPAFKENTLKLIGSLSSNGDLAEINRFWSSLLRFLYTRLVPTRRNVAVINTEVIERALFFFIITNVRLPEQPHDTGNHLNIQPPEATREIFIPATNNNNH